MTVIDIASYLAPALGLALLLAARRWLGRWPDLWRARRAVLPLVDRLADGDYDDELNAVGARAPVDLAAVADALPEKTGLPLQAREHVGIVDDCPATVRKRLCEHDDVMGAPLASIQYDMVNGQRVYEVGSFAVRPNGMFGTWQYHVRLTPRHGGTHTSLWAHREYNPWSHPRKHYNSESWSAEKGVRYYRKRAQELFGQEVTVS
jgi:hypothetical protein